MGVRAIRKFGEIDEFSPTKGVYPQIFAGYPQNNTGGSGDMPLYMGV